MCGGGHDHGMFTDMCEEADRPAMGKVALCRSLAELCAENRLAEGAHCEMDGGEKAVGKRTSGA